MNPVTIEMKVDVCCYSKLLKFEFLHAMSRDNEIRVLNLRRRNILYLIKSYLCENGFRATAESLEVEANLPSSYVVCDNIDLDSIYLEFSSYYHVKFGKYPSILKKLPAAPSMHSVTICKRSEQKKAENLKENLLKDKTCENIINQTLFVRNFQNNINNNTQTMTQHDDLSSFVQSCLMRQECKLSWNDIIGNSAAIDVIKEAVILPIQYPNLFAREVKPWKSLLIHGPPGCGKTLLAKVLYSETRDSICFLNITSSCVISKWRGESEKILKHFFHYAKEHAPAVIYIDEIEGLTSKRDRSSDHESSKRLKNEFLQLLDGIENNSEGVFILATTNIPWDIDPAFTRRFEKRIMVELPDCEERQSLIEKFMPKTVKWPRQELLHFAEMCNGLTGDEIRLAGKELMMKQVKNTVKLEKLHVQEISVADIEAVLMKKKPNRSTLIQKHRDWNDVNGF